MKGLYVSILFFSLSWTAHAQPIPSIVWGKWIVKRVLPTRAISCWGKKEAGGVIGTELEYSPEAFRWHQTVTKNPVTEATTIAAQQFHDEHSGGGAYDSQVTFEQLGIRKPQVVQILIHHPPASITGGTIDIPGDSILVKDQNTIIFSVCNVYFEARRRVSSGRNGTSP
jgi:hypothetical protein